MFVPEVYVKHWEDFEKLLPKAKVYVYHWHTLYTTKLVLQIFDGVCVFTHEQPEWLLGQGNYIGGRKVNEKSLYEKLNQFEDYKVRKRIEHKWWERRLKRFVRRLSKQYPFIEGRFTTVAFAATEE